MLLPGWRPANALRLIETGAVDTVQVIYNVFDQSPEDELFPACRECDVGLIARIPLDEGGLTGRIGPETEFSGDDFRAKYFRGDRKREVHERVEAIVSDLGIPIDGLAETALRFVLSEPTVSTVIPGMRSIRNIERTWQVSDGRALPGGPARDAARPSLGPRLLRLTATWPSAASASGRCRPRTPPSRC
jgi:aryl-alcohol dehydrogenase-like predicted oxidoreductase